MGRFRGKRINEDSNIIDYKKEILTQINMEFKYINDRTKTPNSKLNKKLSNTVNCDSPFRVLPNFSTPPSRFTRIINPFEQHLIDRLHLPTFSPSVFAKISTPKTDEKFKWTIDDISSLKPADIDEDTISQHVFEDDPHVESLVQQKIDKFFKEKVIVPSPMTEIVRVPLITDTGTPNVGPVQEKHYSEGAAQTILTLPPVLPDHLEEALKPYFTYTENQQKSDADIKNSSLYRQLFVFDDQGPNSCSNIGSNQSSPAHSTGLSPLHLSPLNSLDKSLDNPYDMPELRDCNLSPICRKSPKESRSACRLNFSSKMSIDASIVPDIANQMSTQSIFIDDNSPQPVELLSNSAVNWDMEYKHVSLVSPNSSQDSGKMDVSNTNTPHSKLFTSQRKRLSDSFKSDDEDNKENEPQEVSVRHNRKLFRNDVTDGGYHTEVGTYEESSIFDGRVFASTPSKSKRQK